MALDGVLRQRGHRLPQQQRTRDDAPVRRRRQLRRSRDAAGSCEGRRGRRPHRRRASPAKHGVAVDVATRFRAGLQRRRRSHRARSGEQTLWRGVRQLLQPAAMARV